ncbi:MAG: DUF4150 domain-containing protein, partial [Alphaproteobacteria bacterium]|nr:DUF4150 domain-containing protein [Alphaproteobacteria bacterium]
PATPPGVPVPYPNFAMAGDTEKGTGTVKIKDKTVNLKNKSDMSKTSGDEAGCAAKKGVVTSKNTGKSYFNSWSNDVKFEGESVVRMSDLTTNNHASPGPNTPPQVHIAKVSPGIIKEDENCLVGGYKDIVAKCNERGGEAHHIIPDEYIRDGTRDESTPAHDSFPKIEDACAICVGGKYSGKSQSERSSDVGKKIAKKGEAHQAANPGAGALQDARGHGYMHYYFDAKFGNDPRPVGDAVEIAKEALTNLAAYQESVVDVDCAEKGKECVENQFSDACALDPQPTCNSNVNKSNERFDNMQGRLNQQGHLNSNLMPTRHSSLT